MRKHSIWLAAMILVGAMMLVGACCAEGSDWQERLARVEGVTRVEAIPLDPSARLFEEKYLVIFEQPLDWNDPDAGSFPQRVEIGLRKDAPFAVLETNGYTFWDKYPGMQDGMAVLGRDDALEIGQLLGANYVNVEHRFFGDSRPADMSNTDTRYWQYHTAENAANDYHRIYQALSPLLGDAWVATGSSRGGEMTNVYAYYFPEDMRAYVAYVAPCPMGPEDPRFYEFVYTQIGDDAYGPEQAAELRGLVTDFQVDLLKYKQALLPALEETALAQMGWVYQEQMAFDQLYDVIVLEFAAQFWQYQSAGFEELRAILEMPDGTPEALQAKLQAEFAMLMRIQTPMDWSINCFAWPYYVNGATTYGQYHYDFSWLRAALAAAGVEDALSVTEEMEDGLIWRLVFTEEQRAAFAYDGAFAKSLAASIDTTQAKHLMIYGATDPWTSLRLPDTDNPNVAVFVHPTAPHSVMISTMPEEQRDRAIAILQGWLLD